LNDLTDHSPGQVAAAIVSIRNPKTFGRIRLGSITLRQVLYVGMKSQTDDAESQSCDGGWARKRILGRDDPCFG
jgi:hypothetical protein